MMTLPTKEQIEDYVASLSSSLSAVTPDLPALSDALHKLWLDVSRFGPPELPTITVPESIQNHLPASLGQFTIPPSTPVPPPLPEKPVETVTTMQWVQSHPWKTLGVGVGCLGTGVAIQYGLEALWALQARGRAIKAERTHRRRVVVLLGGDTPLGPGLIAGLIDSGFIVITSVSSSAAVEEIESAGHGFVKALVLDPVAASAWLLAHSQNEGVTPQSNTSDVNTAAGFTEPDPTTLFIRSLHASLSLRFPFNRSGDPYASVTTQFPYIHSIVSLLTLSHTGALAPFERLELSSAYLTHLTQTHILPLHLIQSLLPLLRASYPRHMSKSLGKLGVGRNIVVCVPATDARVGLPFLLPNSVSALANVRAVEVLRREVKASRDVGSSFATKLESKPHEREVDTMSDLRVVLVDVGAVGSSSQYNEDTDEINTSLNEKRTGVVDSDLDLATAGWTQAERTLYGHAYLSALRLTQPRPQSLPNETSSTRTQMRARTPMKIHRFVQEIVKVIGGIPGSAPASATISASYLPHSHAHSHSRRYRERPGNSSWASYWPWKFGRDWFTSSDSNESFKWNWNSIWDSDTMFGLRIFCLGLRNSVRGDRICIGAGAMTYAFASRLPRPVLDVLVNLPVILVSWRDRILMSTRGEGKEAEAKERRVTRKTEADLSAGHCEGSHSLVKKPGSSTKRLDTPAATKINTSTSGPSTNQPPHPNPSQSSSSPSPSSSANQSRASSGFSSPSRLPTGTSSLVWETGSGSGYGVESSWVSLRAAESEVEHESAPVDPETESTPKV